MNPYNIPDKYKVQSKLNKLLHPSVGILASPKAEASLLKNDLSYVELFRQFNVVPHAEIVNSVSKSSKKTQVFQLDNFNINFIDLNILSKIDPSFYHDVMKNMLKNSLTKEQILQTVIKNDDFFKSDFSYSMWYENMVLINNQFIDEAKFYNYINSIIGVIYVVSSDEIDVIKTVKNMEERLEKLLNDPYYRSNTIFYWSSKMLHRYFLVVSDKSEAGDLKKNQRTFSNTSTNSCSSVMDYMQIHFNGDGYYIEINSGQKESLSFLNTISFYQQLLLDNSISSMDEEQNEISNNKESYDKPNFVDPLNATSVGNNMSIGEQSQLDEISHSELTTLNRIHRQLYYMKSENKESNYIKILKKTSLLNISDIEKITNFMMVYVTNSLIPFLLDLKIQIQQALNTKLRGTKYFLNSAKEFFRYGKKQSSQLLPVSSSISSFSSFQSNTFRNSNSQYDSLNSTGDNRKLLQSSYDSLFFNYNNVNALKKFQADVTFILQDYNEAYYLYTQLYKDINANDSDIFIRISSLEMRLITSFFIDDTKIINVMQFDPIHTTYLATGNHIRFCYLLTSIFISLNKCYESCALLTKFCQNFDNNPYLGIVLEQVGSLVYRCAQMNQYASCQNLYLRKFSYYMLNAGHDYYKNNHFLHCHLCYRKAYQCYSHLNWSYIRVILNRIITLLILFNHKFCLKLLLIIFYS